MHIRTATNLDRDDIRAIYLSAFEEAEREIVSRLAIDLLSEESIPLTISQVAEADGTVVGHVAFSPVSISKNGAFQGYILAPLAVRPDCQKQGIGSELVGSGMQLLSEMGVNILFVYGDPNYYGRFGFSAEVAARFTPPYRLQYPFGWQGVYLNGQDVARPSGKVACVGSLCDPELW